MSWFNFGAKPNAQPVGANAPAQPLNAEPSAQPTAASVDLHHKMAAITQAQAIVEFTLEGRITDANSVFCDLSGYSPDELRNQRAQFLAPAGQDDQQDGRALWARLARGESEAGQFRLSGKGGREIWLQGAYSPVMNALGLANQIVLAGFDVTAIAKDRMSEHGLSEAVNASFASIEFDITGNVLHANSLFLGLMGYQLAEIVGKPHRMFVDPVYAGSGAYMQFWSDLNAGKAVADTFKRIARSGSEVWIQAVYTPVKDDAGRVTKIVKIATDVTTEKLRAADFAGQLAAISKAQAVIEFGLDGKILDANENFCATLGYALADIKGQHHSMFVDAADRAGPEYRIFWEKLGRGEYDAGQYKRIGKGGKEVWIQASYNPIMDLSGKPFKVVKYATDITAEKLRAADFAGQLAAISKAQAVIEFGLDGKIIDANENFCATLGYALADIKGQHHSMFVDAADRAGPEYRIFWEKLGRGEYDAGQYKRIGKGGKEVWIQASYNPIMDLNGKPLKVVKYATDITERIKAAQVLQKAVEETQSVVAAAKENDLTQRIPLDGKTGEIEALCSGVNGLIDAMAAIVANAAETASTISTAVAEITSGTDDLSRRTENQASSLEETSASMEEIASTIRQNSENAQQASKLAVDARSVAVDGGDIVNRAVTAMSKIEESSGKVSDIIGVIDEIAFQTNLLALNAAVEAARAGDAGRGFAVVASEVRSLAQRSSEAAKDIKALIIQSGAQVKDGVKLVSDTGNALGEIVNSVKRVTDIVAEIASASREQSVGVEEINKAVSQMDEMTQQNSALVEENAAACRLLQEQAEDMAARMALFRLDAAMASTIVSKRPTPKKPAPPKAEPERQAARAPMRKVAGGGGRGAAALQADLRTAFSEDQDWKEF